MKNEKVYRINSPYYWDMVYEDEAEKELARIDIGRWQMLSSYVEKGNSICDFGSGPAYFLSWLKEQKLNCKLTGIDFSDFAIKLNKKKFKGINFIKANTIVGGNYDVITIQHVIEHYWHPQLIFWNAYNQLKDEGTLLVVLPVYDKKWKEHIKIWTLEDVRSLMKKIDVWWQGILVHRPETGLYHDTGEPIEEVILVMKKRRNLFGSNKHKRKK